MRDACLVGWERMAPAAGTRHARKQSIRVHCHGQQHTEALYETVESIVEAQVGCWGTVEQNSDVRVDGMPVQLVGQKAGAVIDWTFPTVMARSNQEGVPLVGSVL